MSMDIDVDVPEIAASFHEGEMRRTGSFKRRLATVDEGEGSGPKRMNSIKRRLDNQDGAISGHDEYPNRIEVLRKKSNEFEDGNLLEAEKQHRRAGSFKRRIDQPESKEQEPASKRTGSIKRKIFPDQVDQKRSVYSNDNHSENKKRNGSIKARKQPNQANLKADNTQLVKVDDFKSVLRGWKKKTEMLVKDKLLNLRRIGYKNDLPPAPEIDGKSNFFLNFKSINVTKIDVPHLFDKVTNHMTSPWTRSKNP